MFIKCYFVSPSFDCCFCYGTIYICQQLTCFSNNSVLNKSHEAPKIFCLSHKLLFCSVMVTIIVYMLKCCFPFSVFFSWAICCEGHYISLHESMQLRGWLLLWNLWNSFFLGIWRGRIVQTCTNPHFLQRWCFSTTSHRASFEKRFYVTL